MKNASQVFWCIPQAEWSSEGRVLSSRCEFEVTGEPASSIKSGHAIIILSLGVCGRLWLLEPREGFKRFQWI